MCAEVVDDGVTSYYTSANPLNIDITAPVVSDLTITTDGTKKIGDTVLLTITADAAGYSSGAITVNGASITGFTDNGDNTYTGTYTVASGNTDRASGAVPVSVILTDAAGNSNVAYTTVTANTVIIDANAPTISLTGSTSTILNGMSVTSVAVELSEVSTDFVMGDVTVTNGTLSNFVGSGTGYTFDVTATGATPMTAVVNTGTFTDAAGNDNSTSNTLSYTVDFTAPTATSITFGQSAFSSGQTATVTIVLSEAASGATFDNTDVTVQSGTLSTLTTANNITWTGTFTPTASIEDATNVATVGTGWMDIAGNTATSGATSANYSIDTFAPTATSITFGQTAFSSGQTTTVTIVLSEAATAFTNADVTVESGSLSAITTADNITWTGTFTPTGSIEDTTNVATIGTVWTDLAGNTATAGATSANYTVDTVVPTVTMVATPSSVNSGATSTITFTLSESSVDFGSGDVSVSGGALSGFVGSGTGYSATFTPTPSSTASGTVNVASSTFTDAAGNNNPAATELVIGVDTQSPFVTSITYSDSAFSSGQTATVTIVLSEAASGATFDNTDVTVESGTLSTITTADNVTWTGTFTPTASIEDATNVATVGIVWTDIAGNTALSGATSANYAIDTVVPTISMVAVPTSVNSGATSVITFTLSESSVNFTSGDVSVAGGTFGSFMGSGMSYSGVFTPTASSTATGTVNVAAAAFTDAAGNDNVAATELEVSVDTIVPTVTLTTSASSPTNANFTVLATFSKPVTGVTSGDFNVTNGVASAFTALSSTGYTVLITPPLDGATTVYISGASAQDSFLNNNEPSNTLSVTYDGTDPTVVLSTSAANPTNGAFTVLATFSEPVTGVLAGDFSVSNGTKNTFTALSSTGYSIVVTPITDGAVDINMAFNAALDLATNPSTTATQLTRTYDSIPPTIAISASGTSVHSGTTSLVTFTLSEPSTNFSSGDVVVTGGTITGFAGSGTGYTATFVPTGSSTASGLINVATGTFSDAATNNNAVAATEVVIDVDTVVPTITMTASGTNLYTPHTSALTFTLSEPSTNFSSGDVVVTGGTITGFAGSGTGYTATFVPTPSSTASGLINVTAGAFTDAFSNNNVAATQLVINVDTTTETDAPVIFNKRVDSISATGGIVKFDFTDASYTVGTGLKTGTGYITIGTGASSSNIGTSGIAVVTGSTNTASAAFDALTTETTYNFAVSVTDNYGNVSTLSTGSFVTANSTPVDVNTSTTSTGTTTLTGASITAGSGLSLSGTVIVNSDPNDTNALTGSLTLSGVTNITVSGSTWNGNLTPPTLIQSGSSENASTGEISTIIPQTTIVVVGNTTTTTTYTSTILQTVKVGAENGVSLIASGANFRVSFVVPGSSSGTTLKLYRSTNGSIWEANSPDATCTLDASKVCTFETNHLSFFAPTLVTASSSSVTVSSGGSGGGGGGSASIDYCPTGDTSGSYYDGKCSATTGTATPGTVTTTTVTATGTITTTVPTGTGILPVSSNVTLLFTDISSNWAKLYIEALANAGVINNTSKFNPDNNVTRAEFLKMALRGLKVSYDTSVLSSEFSDVKEAWQISLVVKAKSLGIISGQMVDGTLMFRPSDTITRAEAMKILLLTAGYKSDATSTEFTDVTEAWQIPLVAKAQGLGIVSGQTTVDGKLVFRPNDTITRAEVAKIIVKTSLMR